MKEYKNQIIDGIMSVWLQEIGWHAAKLGRDLMIGDKLVYNCGYTGEIMAIERETPKNLFVAVLSEGELYRNIKIGKQLINPL